MEITMHKYNFLRIARMTTDDGGASGENGSTAESGGGSGTTQQDGSAGQSEAAGAGTDGEQSLGDAGKKALDAMKAERKAARDEAAAVKAERDALQAKLDGKEAEYAAEQERQRIKDDALRTANKRIVKSEVKAAAKGVLADPQDAYSFLDIDAFDVDENGNVDEDAIAKALTDLVAAKPYLAAQSGKQFQGGADGGARNGSSKSIDQAIAEAETARDFQTVIALKQRRAAELSKKS